MTTISSADQSKGMGNDQSINLSTQEKSYAERVKDAQPEFLEAMGKLAEGKFTVSEETKRLIDQEAEAPNGDRSGERAIWRAEMTGLLASAINIFTGRPLALSGDLKAETVLIMSFVTNMEATNKVFATKSDLTEEEVKFREGLNAAQSACQRLGVEVASVWQGIGDPLCIPADPKEAMKGGFLEARLNLLRNGGELPPPSPSVDAKVAELDEEVTKIINASTGESSEPEALKKSARSLARGAVTRDDATRKIGGMGER